MKYLIAILKGLGLLVTVLGGTVVFIYFLDAKSWWAVVAFIAAVLSPLLYQRLTEIKRCPKCNTKCRATGVAGTKYKQWYCTNCKEKFWTTLYLEDYE